MTASSEEALRLGMGPPNSWASRCPFLLQLRDLSQADVSVHGPRDRVAGLGARCQGWRFFLALGWPRFSSGRRGGAPPRSHTLDARGLDRFAEVRHHEARAVDRRELEQRFGWLVPRVNREIEGAPVHRQERWAAEQREGS